MTSKKYTHIYECSFCGKKEEHFESIDNQKELTWKAVKNLHLLNCNKPDKLSHPPVITLIYSYYDNIGMDQQTKNESMDQHNNYHKYIPSKLENDIKNFIDNLSEEGWNNLYNALYSYKKTGIASIIPFSNFTFFVEFGILEDDKNHSKLNEILGIIENRL